MQPEISILISSHNRIHLLKRTLWSIAMRKPSLSFEVVLADDGSDEPILSLLEQYASVFPWTFIRFDSAEFEQKTGLKKYYNCPCASNNAAWKFSRGNYLFLQGNEVIPWLTCYDQLLADAPKDTDNWMVMSTTYDIPPDVLQLLEPHGANLDARFVKQCERFPLQSKYYRSDVTNYISLAPRSLWEQLQGYDERYFAGISAEDSDFVRRARCLPNFKQVISDGVSLHQSHGGRTCYYEADPKVIAKDRFDEGCKINRKIYDAWDGTYKNPTPWATGEIGIKEVIKNWK